MRRSCCVVPRKQVAKGPQCFSSRQRHGDGFRRLRGRQSGEDKPVQQPLVRTFSSGEVFRWRSHTRKHFASPDQSRRALVRRSPPRKWWSRPRQLVAAVTETLMQQRHLVIVLTSSDGLECFPASHKETQTTFAKQHNLAYRYVTFLNLSAPFVILTGVSRRIS